MEIKTSMGTFQVEVRPLGSFAFLCLGLHEHAGSTATVHLIQTILSN